MNDNAGLLENGWRPPSLEIGRDQVHSHRRSSVAATGAVGDGATQELLEGPVCYELLKLGRYGEKLFGAVIQICRHWRNVTANNCECWSANSSSRNSLYTTPITFTATTTTSRNNAPYHTTHYWQMPSNSASRRNSADLISVYHPSTLLDQVRMSSNHQPCNGGQLLAFLPSATYCMLMGKQDISTAAHTSPKSSNHASIQQCGATTQGGVVGMTCNNT